ncbi:MAG: universal stress protein [Caldilineaceae bacterium]
MYNKILVPLDGSKRAEKILPYVEALAQKFGATLILLQVVEPLGAEVAPYDIVPIIDTEVFEGWVKDAKTYLAGLQSGLGQQQIEVKILVESGSIAPTILDVADREQVDLIAMASHGRTGLSRVFYGSVAAAMLNRADRPLLLIRAED